MARRAWGGLPRARTFRPGAPARVYNEKSAPGGSMQFSKLLRCSLPLAPTSFAADTGIWKVAPPPPASWQRDRVADLSARRQALMDQIGDRAVLILYAAEPRNYAGDVEWPFRQENDFFYLTGLTQPRATPPPLPPP